MLRTDALDYDLPDRLIATHPAKPRDNARLMVVSREDPSDPRHLRVRDLDTVLRRGDVLVRNVTRVLPARFVGTRLDSGGSVEGLYLSPQTRERTGHTRWVVLLKMRRHTVGSVVEIERVDISGRARTTGVRLRLLERAGDDGEWTVRVEDTDAGVVEGTDVELLGRVGMTALPPYIRAARKRDDDAGDDNADQDDYQTVYAQDDERAMESGDAPGSVAAPTAGLHFTDALLGRLRDAGVEFADVVLHVGMGTFKPVETEFVEQHPMHAEWCYVPESSARAIERATRDGRRVIPVGTTSARTLESFASTDHMLQGPHATRLLITPGHEWRWCDGMMTNFHLPRSTLLAMVGAILDRGDGEGVDRLLGVYRQAISEGYRFYSFGDAMLVLP